MTSAAPRARRYDNGDVKLLDLRMGKVRWEANVQNGVCGLQVCAQAPALLAPAPALPCRAVASSPITRNVTVATPTPPSPLPTFPPVHTHAPSDALPTLHLACPLPRVHTHWRSFPPSARLAV